MAANQPFPNRLRNRIDEEMLVLIGKLLPRLNSDDHDDLKFLFGNHLEDNNISSDASSRQMFEGLHRAFGTRDFRDLLFEGFEIMERADLCEQIRSCQNSIDWLIRSSAADDDTIPAVSVAISETADAFANQNIETPLCQQQDREIDVTDISPVRSGDFKLPTSFTYSFESSIVESLHAQQETADTSTSLLHDTSTVNLGSGASGTFSSVLASTPLKTETLSRNEASNETHHSSKVEESVGNAKDSGFYVGSEMSSSSLASASSDTFSSEMSAYADEMNFAEPIEMTSADMEKCMLGQEIGRGGFGIVYKGVFKGKDVAVKKGLLSQSTGKSFLKEKQLAFLRFTYLMPILAFSSPDGMIMYPYMEGGDLTKVIKDLDWRNRIRVFYQCSEGLAFLHRTVPQIRFAIIHGDIKPDNILLDACLNARLGDIGIAAELLRDVSHYTITSNNVRGTNGYIDPFKKDGEQRKENDIFSLGIVGLQLLKWQPAVLKVPKGNRFVEKSLADHFYETFGENFQDAEQFVNSSVFLDKDVVWKDVDDTVLKESVKLILLCVIDPNQITRITADKLAVKLSEILSEIGMPRYAFPSGDNTAESFCLYCCFRKSDPDLTKVSFTEKCSDDCVRHFCQYCCEKAYRNPLHCLDHGLLPHLTYAENGYAILISGFGELTDDGDDQKVFNEDVENIYRLLIDPKIMGFRKENVYQIIKPAVNKRHEIIEKLQMLKEKPVGLLIIYYSGHGNEERELSVSEDDNSNIKDSELSELLGQINCTWLLVILDCCSAGQYKVLPQTSLGRVPDWRIQLNGASANKPCSMSNDDKSVFTRSLIYAISGGHTCPLSEENGIPACRRSCDKFRRLCEARGYIDMYDVIGFCSEHLKQDAQKEEAEDPEVHMMAGELLGQTKLAPFNKKSMYTFRFQNRDNRLKFDFNLAELKPTIDEILSALWDKIKACPSVSEPMNYRCLEMTCNEQSREPDLSREDLEKQFNRGQIVQVSIRDKVCNLNVNRNVVIFGSHKKSINALERKYTHWFTEKETVLGNFSCFIKCSIVDEINEISDGHSDKETKYLLDILKSALKKAKRLSQDLLSNNDPQVILGLQIDVRENFVLLSLRTS